jgi:hypothetical protein
MVWKTLRNLMGGRGNDRGSEEEEVETVSERSTSEESAKRSESGLDQAQINAIELAKSKTKEILDEIDTIRKARRKGALHSGLSIANANRIKEYSIYEEALKNGTDEERVEAAVKVLFKCGQEITEKVDWATERAKKLQFPEKDGQKIMTPGTMSVIEDLGREIQGYEASLADLKRNLMALTGKG